MVSPTQNPLDIVNDIFNHGREFGIAQLVDQSDKHDGRIVSPNGKPCINLGSCGYMGLEFEPRLKEAGIEAIRKYGIEFSSSRAYLSNPLYPQLEELLERIFLRPTLLAPTTTLMHLSALPVLVGADDVVLLDQQVHSSVQLAAKVLRSAGVQVDFIPHNNIPRLERKIRSYRDTKKKIWYLGDGVYSMYGDFAPVNDLFGLLSTYEQLNLYLDDAHGMSWSGNRGCGYVLKELPHHERLFVATSLAKGFGTGGGAIICPDQETKQKIRNCGGTQIFVGPIQPGILGAAIESAKIHLSPEFPGMQKELEALNETCTSAAESLPLPMISDPRSPVRFLGVSSIDLGQKMVKRLIDQGYWLNIAQYPAIGPNHTGLRFMMTRKIRQEDVRNFMDAVRLAAQDIIGSDESTYQQIWKAFSKEYRYSLVNG
jgi:7-keto-8-aminopelargonate synthetase-like enzyme